MKNKKIAVIFIIIVIIVAILSGLYKIMISYMFEKEEHIELNNGHKEMINYLKTIEDDKEKEIKVKLFLEENKITEAEAREILGK